MIDVTGINYDRMNLLGYSATESLLYDQCETQNFYLLKKSTSKVYRLSPAEAKNWLVQGGGAGNWVYDPFDNNVAPSNNPTIAPSSIV